jgi:hypothetical protein
MYERGSAGTFHNDVLLLGARHHNIQCGDSVIDSGPRPIIVVAFLWIDNSPQATLHCLWIICQACPVVMRFVCCRCTFS